ncbi:MAG: exo-alpha-sialidase [Candidatus Hydrogenedentes bacterium]|nr:exo-alpha-sialidase [Candidatus Hydrogenedentota bacterium]
MIKIITESARAAGACILLLACTAAIAQAPANAAPRMTPLFQAGDGGVDTYRIPALAITTKGTLLAFCEARWKSSSDTGNIDLVMRRSTDNGATWEPMATLVNDGDSVCGNPCPIVDQKTGDIILLITKNIGSEHQDQIMRGEASPRTPWMLRSADDGVTWSAPVDISAQARKPDWRWYATGPGHGIQLTGGRLVAPCDHSTGPEDADLHSHVIFSDDGGNTWQVGGVLPGTTDESIAVELANGDLYLNMRNMRGDHRRYISTSPDKGVTWTPARMDPALIEPVCQASALRLSMETEVGKNRILFSNPASEKRENLTVRVSYDECATWPVGKTLWAGPAAYSDLVVCPDKSIGCLFERGENSPYETITFAQFPLEWLTDGKDMME